MKKLTNKITPNVGFILFLPHIYKGPPGGRSHTCGTCWEPFWLRLGAFRITFGRTLHPFRGTLGSLGVLLGGERSSGRPLRPRIRCVMVLKPFWAAYMSILGDQNPSNHSAGPIDSQCAAFLTCIRKCAILCPYFCHFLTPYGPMGPPVDA